MRLHFILGQSLAGKGYLEEAEIQFTAAVEIQSSLWQAGYKLGMIYAEREQYYKAIECFSKAVGQQKGYFYIFESLVHLNLLYIIQN